MYREGEIMKERDGIAHAGTMSVRSRGVGYMRCIFFFFFKAKDGIRVLVRSGGRGDV